MKDKSVTKRKSFAAKEQKRICLQALRERQAKIKEQEQNMSKENPRHIRREM